MPHYKGSCYCRDVQYELQLDSPEQGRTSLCHCWSCKKFFGTPFGVTTKVPLSSYKLTQGQPREHVSPNGLHREFCANCGTGILEYGDAAREQWRYVMYGTMDETGQEELTPKGEFFCKERNSWVPEVQGVFHKNELKE